MRRRNRSRSRAARAFSIATQSEQTKVSLGEPHFGQGVMAQGFVAVQKLKLPRRCP